MIPSDRPVEPDPSEICTQLWEGTFEAGNITVIRRISLDKLCDTSHPIRKPETVFEGGPPATATPLL